MGKRGGGEEGDREKGIRAGITLDDCGIVNPCRVARAPLISFPVCFSLFFYLSYSFSPSFFLSFSLPPSSPSSTLPAAAIARLFSLSSLLSLSHSPLLLVLPILA